MTKQPAPYSDNEEWFTRQVILGDYPLFVTGPTQLPVDIGSSQHPERINVFWDFGADGESGLPSAESLAEMDEFESTLIPSLIEKDSAVFVLYITHRGIREWIFYCRDKQATAKRINQVFSRQPKKPIELEGADDPEWLQYRDIVTKFLAPEAEE